MGFTGGNLTDSGGYNPDDPLYFSSYGNLTRDIIEQRAENSITQ